MGEIMEDCEEKVERNSNNNNYTYSLPFYKCSADGEFLKSIESDMGKWCPYCSNCKKHCKCGYLISLRTDSNKLDEDCEIEFNN